MESVRLLLAESDRVEILPVGLYSLLIAALVLEASCVALRPQSTTSGYVYPKDRVDRAVADV